MIGRPWAMRSSGEPGPVRVVKDRGCHARRAHDPVRDHPRLASRRPAAARAGTQLFDYVSFMVMIERHGLAAELNPIVVTLHQNVGLVGLTVVKASAVVFLASTAVLLMTRRTNVAFGSCWWASSWASSAVCPT